MTSVIELREQIAELEAIAAEAVSRTDFASRLTMQGVDQLRQDLVDAVGLALRPELSVRIEGAPVYGHEIRVDALTRLLFSLQESISSVAQAITGTITERAALPSSIRDVTALRLAVVFPGSFGAMLRGPVDKEVDEMVRAGQEPLFEPLEKKTLLDEAVDTVLDVIALAAGDDADDGPIIDAVLPLGGRAFKHLLELSDAIVDREMTAALAWKHMGKAERNVTVSRRSAQRLNDVLTMNKVTEHSETFRGYLGTASEFRGRLEIQTDEGPVISAKVVDDVVAQLSGFFGRRVVANATVTLARSTATGTERRSYIVTGLAADDGEQPDSPS